jgi:hypothetical protein
MRNHAGIICTTYDLISAAAAPKIVKSVISAKRNDCLDTRTSIDRRYCGSELGSMGMNSGWRAWIRV